MRLYGFHLFVEIFFSEFQRFFVSFILIDLHAYRGVEFCGISFIRLDYVNFINRRIIGISVLVGIPFSLYDSFSGFNTFHKSGVFTDLYDLCSVGLPCYLISLDAFTGKLQSFTLLYNTFIDRTLRIRHIEPLYRQFRRYFIFIVESVLCRYRDLSRSLRIQTAITFIFKIKIYYIFLLRRVVHYLIVIVLTRGHLKIRWDSPDYSVFRNLYGCRIFPPSHFRKHIDFDLARVLVVNRACGEGDIFRIFQIFGRSNHPVFVYGKACFVGCPFHLGTASCRLRHGFQPESLFFTSRGKEIHPAFALIHIAVRNLNRELFRRCRFFHINIAAGFRPLIICGNLCDSGLECFYLSLFYGRHFFRR